MSEKIDKLYVRVEKNCSLTALLEERDYLVEEVEKDILRISKPEIIDVYLHVDEQSIFFEVEVGDISKFGNEEVYKELLALNTEIVPVSIALDLTDGSDDKQARVLLVEQREAKNLDENELLAVLDAMEIASVKVEVLLSKYLTNE